MPDFVAWREVAPFHVVTKEDLMPTLHWGKERRSGVLSLAEASGRFGREELAAIEFAVLLRARRFYGTTANSMLTNMVLQLRKQPSAAAAIGGPGVAVPPDNAPLWGRTFAENPDLVAKVLARQQRWADNPPPYGSEEVMPIPTRQRIKARLTRPEAPVGDVVSTKTKTTTTTTTTVVTKTTTSSPPADTPKSVLPPPQMAHAQNAPVREGPPHAATATGATPSLDVCTDGAVRDCFDRDDGRWGWDVNHAQCTKFADEGSPSTGAVIARVLVAYDCSCRHFSCSRWLVVLFLCLNQQPSWYCGSVPHRTPTKLLEPCVRSPWCAK